MEATRFEDVMKEAASATTALDPDALDVNTFKFFRRAATTLLEKAWAYHFWPFAERTEKRYFRPNVAGTEAAGQIAYYPATDAYYQALQSNPPVNPDDPAAAAYWTAAEVSYAADAYNPLTTYAQGERVSFGDGSVGFGANIYQLFAVTATGVTPTDATQWAVLVPFDRYVDYDQTGQTPIGVVTAAWSADPRATTRGKELNWNLSADGVQILTAVNFVWLEFRTRAPLFFGDVFDATLEYDAGQQVYWGDPVFGPIPSDFYNILAHVNPGQNPENAAVLFGVVEIPRLFHRYLGHALAAEWLRGPGGASAEDVAQEMADAEAALEDAKTLFVGQQSQRVKTVVRTR